MVQQPNNTHGLGTLVLPVASCTQVGIGGRSSTNVVSLELANKEQNLASAFFVMDVPLPCRRMLSSSTLALPVE